MPSREEKMLVGAAQVIGKVVGKIAGVAGAKAEPDKRHGSGADSPPMRRTSKSGKLEKKPRTHLPRRQKKAKKKTA